MTPPPTHPRYVYRQNHPATRPLTEHLVTVEQIVQSDVKLRSGERQRQVFQFQVRFFASDHRLQVHVTGQFEVV